MRSFNPTDKYDQEELARLNAEPWMLHLLEQNPDYVHWGPGEDAMATEGSGWGSSIVEKTWAESGFKTVDELNEVPHFYFAIERSSKQCPSCEGDGYNPKTSKLAKDYYSHSSSTGVGWSNNITQDEVQALLDSHRLHDLVKFDKEGKPDRIPTAQEVNDWNNRTGAYAGKRGFLGHDGINRYILIKARAKRLGFYGKCPECQGHGEVFTAQKAHVELTLWVLHPRKGASRGVRISKVNKSDLPEIFQYLKQAHERNTARFARLDLTKVLAKSQA